MMKPEIEALIHLQAADQQIAALRAAIAALPKHLAAVEEKLRSQKATVEQVEKAMKDEEAQRRRLESDLKDQQQKIVKFREQSSSVKTNEQYHALQHEISFAEAEIRKIEDRELESMERSEQLEARRRSAQEDLAAQTKLVEQEKELARTASVDQQRQLELLVEEQTKFRTLVEEQTLVVYDRVAKSRGTGLARATGQQCLGCQMFLRPQIWNQVRNGDLIPCESCTRLLYFDPALEPQPEPPKPEAPKKKKKAEEAADTPSGADA